MSTLPQTLRSPHLTLSTTSSTLALILLLCSGDVPTARVYRVWIPITCIGALPIAQRARRWLGVDAKVEEGGLVFADSIDLGSEHGNETGKPGEVFSSARHECGKWKRLGIHGVLLGSSVMLLVASAAAGRVLEAICVLALASPFLHLFTSSHTSTDPSPLLLLSIISTSLYLTSTSQSPSHHALPQIFSTMWSASGSGLAGVGFALGLVGVRVGAGKVGGGLVDGLGEAGCRGCEGRVAGIAAIVISIFTSILFPIYAPSIRSLPLILLTSALFAWSPPALVSASPSTSDDAPTSATSPADRIFLELTATTILLALVKHRDSAYTVQALLFGLAVLVIHLVRDAASTPGSHTNTITTQTPNKGFLASNEEDVGPAARKRKVYLAMACAPAALWAMKRVHGLGSVHGTGTGTGGSDGLVTAWEAENFGVQATTWKKAVDYELAIAYYNEPRDSLSETIQFVKSSLPSGSTSRTTVYFKGPETLATNAVQEMDALMKEVGADAVVALENRGREGETYLQHITRNYASTAAPLATHTIFLQPHIAWDWVAKPRLGRLRPEIGFVSLGPYLNATCSADGNELDSHGMSFGRIPQIYAAFNGDFCPPTGFAITWAGQFVVSRTRILSTPLATYQNLLDYFTVPKGENHAKDWIWSEGWWNSQPSDPTHGHWLERSWPAIFHCTRPELGVVCGEKSGTMCECLDE